MTRDWQEDVELAHTARYENAPIYLNPVLDALFYWLQQASKLASEQAYAKEQANAWNDKAVVEKERADIAEFAYRGLAESAVTRGEYESLLDKHTAMTKAYRAEKERADRAKRKYARFVLVAEQWNDQLTDTEKLLREAESREKKLREARPIEEWHEDYGDVLWWTFPIEEAPYCGNPLDSDWPDCHTHWTPFVVPEKEEEA